MYLEPSQGIGEDPQGEAAPGLKSSFSRRIQVSGKADRCQRFLAALEVRG
jgi:hypothetical protein